MTKPLNVAQKERILKLLAEGTPRLVIARLVNATPGQVSAIAAHRTMGTYSSGKADDSTENVAKQRSELVGPVLVRFPARAKLASSRDNAGIFVGFDVHDNTEVYWKPAADEGPANPHVLIVGESGFGKTYATSCLLAELSQAHVSSVIFDYGQGFSDAALPKGFSEWTRAMQFELNRDGIAINPLEIFPVDLHGPATVAQRIADTFARVYPKIGVQQHAIIRRAVLEVFDDAGIKQHDRSTWEFKPPHFRNVERRLTTFAENLEAPSRRAAMAAASHISTLFVFDTFRSTGNKLTWNDLVSNDHPQTWVLQLSGLESSVERTVTEFLLWNLIRFVEARGPGKLRCFIGLDEAHKMSFAPGSPVEKLLREGRKFGLGLILASQQPEDFSPVAFANTATKITFQISDEKGLVFRQLSRKTHNSDMAAIARDVITKLPRGSAYIVTENIGNIVRIASFEERTMRWAQNGNKAGHVNL